MSEQPFNRRACDDDLDGSFKLCPKFDRHDLTDEQIDQLTTNAAKKAVLLAKTEFYQGVGETVVNKLYWLVGVAAVGLLVLGIKMGWVKP